MPAPAETVDVVTTRARAVAVEVDADFVARAASPAASTVVRERPQRRGVYGFVRGHDAFASR
jgi:hypothetical protein